MNWTPVWTAALFIYFASAAVAVDPSHMTASSFASWSRFSPPSNFGNGHVSTMWYMVCRKPESQEGDWTRPHLCELAHHGPWPVQKRFIRNHVRQRRWKSGSRVGNNSVVDHRSQQMHWESETYVFCTRTNRALTILVLLQPINTKYSCDTEAHRVTGSTCSGQFSLVHVLQTSL